MEDSRAKQLKKDAEQMAEALGNTIKGIELMVKNSFKDLSPDQAKHMADIINKGKAEESLKHASSELKNLKDLLNKF
jgi:hypothetical protein